MHTAHTQTVASFLFPAILVYFLTAHFVHVYYYHTTSNAVGGDLYSLQILHIWKVANALRCILLNSWNKIK